MDFEYGNVNNRENFGNISLLRRFREWDSDVKQLLSQLSIKYAVLPICGTTICYRRNDGRVNISLRTWRYYDNKRYGLSISRTEFINFLQNLAKKRKIIAKVLPQPIAEEITEQYSATAELVEFIDNNNASK